MTSTALSPTPPPTPIILPVVENPAPAPAPTSNPAPEANPAPSPNAALPSPEIPYWFVVVVVVVVVIPPWALCCKAIMWLSGFVEYVTSAASSNFPPPTPITAPGTPWTNVECIIFWSVIYFIK